MPNLLLVMLGGAIGAGLRYGVGLAAVRQLGAGFPWGTLLVNLAGSAWLYARFLRHKGPFTALERWQVAYLPVYSAWAALVVVIFPPLFGYR